LLVTSRAGLLIGEGQKTFIFEIVPT
jgi:hypothetical protein